MHQFKYIRSRYRTFVFSESDTHKDMARRVFNDNEKVESAGFGMIITDPQGNPDVHTYGHSVTLGVGSVEDDRFFVKQTLGLNGLH